jgi:membrane-associated phospholipid phosphatase
LAGSAAGLLIVLANTWVQHPLLNDWLSPPLVLLLAYWTSGLLFVAPMPRVERVLVEIDCQLRVRHICAATPRPLAEFLEVAYAAVYVVIPIALVLQRTVVDRPDAARFWTVILVTDYICFGMLPWIQTRPPRAIEPGEPWTAKFRTWNLRMLGKTSIQVNTFPSGHAAEAMAAALLVIGAPAPIVTLMFLTALSVSAGAVLGRYHYAADIFAGWLVAALVVSR